MQSSPTSGCASWLCSREWTASAPPVLREWTASAPQRRLRRGRRLSFLIMPQARSVRRRQRIRLLASFLAAAPRPCLSFTAPPSPVLLLKRRKRNSGVISVARLPLILSSRCTATPHPLAGEAPQGNGKWAEAQHTHTRPLRPLWCPLCLRDAKLAALARPLALAVPVRAVCVGTYGRSTMLLASIQNRPATQEAPPGITTQPSDTIAARASSQSVAQADACEGSSLAKSSSFPSLVARLQGLILKPSPQTAAC
jgi:hypothetical protein